MKECIKCGAVVEDNDSHCKYCGVLLGAVQTPSGYSGPADGAYQPPRYPDPPSYSSGTQQAYNNAPNYNQQQNYSNPQQNYAQPQQNYAQPQPNPYAPVYYDPALYSNKDKLVAGLLGIFLGNLGVHKFYLGKIGLGIVYILFSWSFIPGIIGLIEGIIYLCSSEQEFKEKYCRIYRY